MAGTYTPFKAEMLAGRTCHVADFESLSAMTESAKLTGYQVPPHVEEGARSGVLWIVSRSDRLLDRIETEIDVQSLMPQTVASVAGGAVNLGAYLAGSPMAMRQRRMSPRSAADGAIALMINTFSSAGCTEEKTARRGAAALALARALQRVRPVQAYLFEHTNQGGAKNVLFTCRLESQPLDLARAAWASGSNAFTHGTALALQRSVPGYNSCRAQTADQDAEVLQAWAASRGLQNVILTPPLLGSNPHFGTDENAVAWVQAQVTAIAA